MKKKRRTIKALLLFAAAFAAGCGKEILHEVGEARANSALLALSKAGVAAEKHGGAGGWSVSVASADAAGALEVLQRARILGDSAEEPGAPVSGFILSRQERAHFLERSLAKNLQATLERLPGVLEARVHLYLPPEAALSWAPEQGAKSASALLVVSERGAIDPAQVSLIVAGAAGMEARNVSVIISESRFSGPPVSAPRLGRGLALDAAAPAAGLLLFVTAAGGGAAALFRSRGRRASREGPGAQQAQQEASPKLRPHAAPARQDTAEAF